MSFSLYRKYRPQLFAELVGQDHIVSTLKAEVVSGRIAHAYLFTGPRGTGKTTTARLLAKSLSCTGERVKGEPCGACDSCKGYAAQEWPDLIEIDAASNRGIDEIRALKELVRYVPQRSAYKVFIIDEVHMLSTDAFNALLKTVEEPPRHALFILATTEPHKLPATIISRCQRFDFRRVPMDVLVARLKELALKEGVEVDEEVLGYIARTADGGVRDAESVLGQVLALGEKKIGMAEASLVLPQSDLGDVARFIDSLVRHNGNECSTQVRAWQEQGLSPDHYIEEFFSHIRSLIILCVDGGKDRVAQKFGVEATEQWEKTAREVGLGALKKLLRGLIQAKSDASACASVPWLPIELLVIDWARETTDGVARGGDSSLPTAIAAPTTAVSVADDSSTGAAPSDQDSNVDFNASVAALKQALRTESVSLVVLLKNCLMALEKGVLVFTFRYPFHAEKLKDIKNMRLIKTSWEHITGRKVEIEVKIDSNMIITQEGGALEEIKNDEILKSALEIFGGEVIGEER